MRRACIAGACMLALVACDRPRFNSGSACSLNTDCAEPLVCGLERCRRQCADSRDCAAGLLCLRLASGGVCQLPEESRCSLASDCPAALACRFGTCTTACAEDRDCPAGSSCELDEEHGALACVESLTELCVYNSDCRHPMVCQHDQQCGYECRTDVDCDSLRYCSAELRCLPRTDAGS